MKKISLSILLIIALVLQSCAVWHNNPIPIREAVDIGSVKITTGKPLPLDNAVDVGGVTIIRKDQTKESYIEIKRKNDQFIGKTPSSTLIPIHRDSVLLVFPQSSLSTKEFKNISYSEGQYYGLFYEPEQLDTTTIYEVYQKKSDEPNPYAVLGILGGSIVLAAILITRTGSILGGGR